MDSQVRDDHEITVCIYQPGGDTVSGSHDHTACYGKRTVQPGGADHAAVFLHIQLYILVLHLDLCIGFDLEDRRITVACHDLETGKIFFRNEKCNQGRIISGDIVAAAGLQIPFLPLIQTGAAGLL